MFFFGSPRGGGFKPPKPPPPVDPPLHAIIMIEPSYLFRVIMWSNLDLYHIVWDCNCVHLHVGLYCTAHRETGSDFQNLVLLNYF